jgi:glucose-6-phosphate 1-dehydrogenase
MPAIVRLHEEGKLPEGFRVLGIAQDDWNQEKFRSHLKEKLAASGTVGVSGLRETILGKIDYCRADVTNRDQLAQALSRVTGPLVAYLALPPALFAQVAQGEQGRARKTLWGKSQVRAIVESPSP